MYRYMTTAETAHNHSGSPYPVPSPAYNKHPTDFSAAFKASVSGQQQRTPAPAEARSSSMTELVLTKHSPDAERLLLPMLAHLSRDTQRWVTWIYDTPVDRKLLNTYGVDTGKIRFIHTDSDECTRWLLWEALSTGTSHTVIATLNELNEEHLILLEKAANEGSSHGLLIRYR